MITQIIQNVILGIIQGLTEFLPVSSSGHLNIAEHLMGMSDGGVFLDVMLQDLLCSLQVCSFLSEFSAIKDRQASIFKRTRRATMTVTDAHATACLTL